jgi:hypothetical protein
VKKPCITWQKLAPGRWEAVYSWVGGGCTLSVWALPGSGYLWGVEYVDLPFRARVGGTARTATRAREQAALAFERLQDLHWSLREAKT